MNWKELDSQIKEELIDMIEHITVEGIGTSPAEWKTARDSKRGPEDKIDNFWESKLHDTVCEKLEEFEISTEDEDYETETFAGCGPIYEKLTEIYEEFTKEEITKL